MSGIRARFSIVCLVLFLGPIPLIAQEPPSEEMVAKWMEFMTPGDNHALLKFKEGKWDLKVKMWMQPGTPPMESVATSEAKLIMEGRYVFDKVQGTFNGMPFEGMGTTAFDNGLKKFVSTWIDNMGTGIAFAEGSYDPEKKAWSYTAKSTDPMSGQSITTRSVERIVSDDSWVLETYGPGPDGKEFQMMEIIYTRNKD
jgi:hypothetical protein